MRSDEKEDVPPLMGCKYVFHMMKNIILTIRVFRVLPIRFYKGRQIGIQNLSNI